MKVVVLLLVLVVRRMTNSVNDVVYLVKFARIAYLSRILLKTKVRFTDRNKEGVPTERTITLVTITCFVGQENL